MIFPSTNDFTPLANLHLPQPCILHPDACNPAMDLVVLLCVSETTSTDLLTARSASVRSDKGKANADVGGHRTKVALWRMSGTKVWEVEVEGKAAGVAWSQDGLHLSILLLRYPLLPPSFLPTGERWKANAAVLQHLSVHTGGTVRALSFTQAVNHISAKDIEDLESGRRWWRMEWRTSGMEWPKAKNGSAARMIDALPRVTPVDPPVPVSVHPFITPNAASNASFSTPHLHAKLDTFPALLPSTPFLSADILHLAPPSGSKSHSLLTGTFPLSSSRIHSPVLDFAETASRLSLLLDVLLRGLETAEHSFTDGEKQTMIWREELETCAEQQGMRKVEVHADLFKLLLTGRSGVAVSEWLGNRLTGRTIAKWELAMETSFKTIQKVVSESISPALERLILLLDEMKGWAQA